MDRLLRGKKLVAFPPIPYRLSPLLLQEEVDLTTTTQTHISAQTIRADRGLAVHGALMLLLGLLSGFAPLFAKSKIAAPRGA
jgi:hypothetical protein